MNYHAKSAERVLTELGSTKNGLSDAEIKVRQAKFGKNELNKKVRKSFFARVFSALKDPMLTILVVGFFITLFANIGKELKTGGGDFTECIGIFAAVVLSVSITLIMEGSSEKAFEALKGISDGVAVKVKRGGKVQFVPQKELVVGDIVLIESGDKITADGRLIESEYLKVDESALTGESRAAEKDANTVLAAGAHLAERTNCVYSGTFVSNGRGAMVVASIGADTEMGKIAGELSTEIPEDSPLYRKLSKLGKSITAVGAVCALAVFIMSFMRLIFAGALSFDTVSDLFISCIVLIIAAVPEGLPTIVAVSLALNMIRLAKEKALIKKMIATETTGAVSVICSDKTGTLTMNKMAVVAVCGSDFCVKPEKDFKRVLVENFILNSTAEEVKDKNERFRGSGTECALLEVAYRRGETVKLRERFKVIKREPFSSEKKYMITAVETPTGARVYIKGAPERVLSLCAATREQKAGLLSAISLHQSKARRALCFAHFDCDKSAAAINTDFSFLTDGQFFTYDGFCALADPVRPEVLEAVKDCKSAGICVKMLTGDNLETALAVARELKIADDDRQAVLGSDVEKMDEESLIKALNRITVVARSTPLVKLKIVKALKKSGEVVALTGDGINDAPAIRHADVGIAMGKSGSEITKEAADVVLLDDGFMSVVKAVEFGRNVYKNLQRFILFQLSVNIAALAFITAAAAFGLPSPFNTLQLLWINVIMDGPPALTLGLEPPNKNLMKLKPVKRDSPLVDKKTFTRLFASGLYMGAIMLFQYLYNFLGAAPAEKSAATFTLFISFQLFNAFNCRELGENSIFKNFGRNKIMVATFFGVFLVHLLIVQVAYKPFGVAPMCAALWIKCLITASSIVAFSELGKLAYRLNKSRYGEKTLSVKVNKNQCKA